MPDPAEQAALNRISAASMRANLSFLASDAMEGRDTPSQALDIAAEFIASRFRLAGLEPVTGDSYFQKAAYALVTSDPSDFSLILSSGAESVHVTRDFDLQTLSAIELTSVPLVKLDSDTPGDLSGKAALIEAPNRENFARFQNILKAAQLAHPAVILMLSSPKGVRAVSTRLVSASAKKVEASPVISIRDPAIETFLAANPVVTVSVHSRAAAQRPVEVHNVAGVLRGSDPLLRDTVVLVTAHYDHIGILPPGDGDRTARQRWPAASQPGDRGVAGGDGT